MADSRVNSHEEKNQRPKEKISKNYKQRRPKGQPQKLVPRRKDKNQAAIKKGKIESWKEFCNITSCTNPWNAVYQLASNKVKWSEILSTLQKSDESLTTDIEETITYISDYLNAKDEVNKDSDYHKKSEH
jgi:hypothetical protein